MFRRGAHCSPCDVSRNKRCINTVAWICLSLNILLQQPLHASSESTTADSIHSQLSNEQTSALTLQYPNTAPLAQNPQWLALLHYKTTASGTPIKSYVLSKPFFLAEEGNTNPQAELLATIAALHEQPKPLAPHASCVFPARKNWIEANSEHQFPKHACTNFTAWADEDNLDSISMVFATGHFSSPASFFGHNFLKLNKSNNADYLLDPAINFGAIMPPNENPLRYIAIGVAGGYEAEFTNEPFYRFLAKYGEQDLRDVWEYKLSLTDEQQSLVIAHLWELRYVRFPYYFFRENCAFQIASLLGTFSDTEFVHQYLPWAMPITVFDNLMLSDNNGSPLVSSIELHRSRRTLFQNRFSESTGTIKNIISAYASGNYDLANTPAYIALDEDNKISVVDTLLDYSAFRSKEKDGAMHKENKRQLLLMRLQLKQSAASRPKKNQSEPPHLSQRPIYTAIGTSVSENNEHTGFIRFRPAYYDFLSLETGRKPHASFTLLDTQLEFGDTTRIAFFDLARISNLNTQFSGIDLDKASSWQLRIGNEAVSDKCNDCNGWLLQWDIGKSKRIGEHLAAFALSGLSINESRNHTANGYLHAHVGITGKLHDQWRLYARASYKESFNRNQPFHSSFELENRFGDSRKWDVRIKLEKRDLAKASVSAAIYW